MRRQRHSDQVILWIVAIATMVVVAGLVSWSLSARRGPEQVPETSGGWNAVTAGSLQRVIDDNQQLWRARWFADASVSASRTVATRWLATVPAGPAHASRQRLVRDLPASRRQTAAALAWGAGIPAARMSTSIDAVRHIGSAERGVVTVAATMTTRVHQARDGWRRIETPVSMTLTPTRAGSERLGPPARWRVTTIRMRRSGLGGIARPVLAAGPVIDVITNAEHAADATEYQREAVSSLAFEQARYEDATPAGSVPAVATVYLVSDMAMLGKLVPNTSKTGTTSRATGWTYDTGDVVLDASKLDGRSRAERLGVVRHEITHLATLPLMTTTPTLFVEGIATAEESRRTHQLDARTLDLAPLLRAFNRGTLDYPALTRSRNPDFGTTDPNRVMLGYLAGYATVMAIEQEYGHAKLQVLLRQLQDGASVDVALKGALGTTLTNVEALTKSWTNVAVHDPTHSSMTTSG